ncbi:MAG: hypothetical protein ACXWFB_09325 [Nitrososphaeraceae archaeon]
MPSIITNIETENCLRELLIKEGYKLGKKSGLGKLGSDIKANKNNEDWYIEVIGFEEAGLERVKDFYEAFFQSISRLNNKECKHCIIAMTESSRKSLPIRAKIYKVAWERIAKVFPELEIWLVDIENKKYQRTPWIYWLERKT